MYYQIISIQVFYTSQPSASEFVYTSQRVVWDEEDVHSTLFLH